MRGEELCRAGSEGRRNGDVEGLLWRAAARWVEGAREEHRSNIAACIGARVVRAREKRQDNGNGLDIGALRGTEE